MDIGQYGHYAFHDYTYFLFFVELLIRRAFFVCLTQKSILEIFQRMHFTVLKQEQKRFGIDQSENNYASELGHLCYSGASNLKRFMKIFYILIQLVEILIMTSKFYFFHFDYNFASQKVVLTQRIAIISHLILDNQLGFTTLATFGLACIQRAWTDPQQCQRVCQQFTIFHLIRVHHCSNCLMPCIGKKKETNNKILVVAFNIMHIKCSRV